MKLLVPGSRSAGCFAGVYSNSAGGSKIQGNATRRKAICGSATDSYRGYDDVEC